MVPSKMVPSKGNPKNRQEEDQWDLDDGERQHRAQHEHHKQQCAQGCCLPSWMTTDTLGLGDGAPRIRQIREQRYEVVGGLCQVNLTDSLVELVGVEAPGGEMVAERRRGSLSRAGQTVGGIATGALRSVLNRESFAARDVSPASKPSTWRYRRPAVTEAMTGSRQLALA